MGMKNFSGNSNPPGMPTGGLPASGTPGASGGLDPMDFLIDYNAKFKTAGPTLFRDELVQQTMAVLIAKNKPNALLIGPAGVGKTKIAEDIAYRMANNDPILPDKLKGCRIYELPLSSIVSGSRYVGDIEQKITTVIGFLSDPKNQAIVFIDEIHQLLGSDQTYGQIAQILKPALARGEIKCIGATTSQEAGELMDDPALNRRFTRIIVDEFDKEQTLAILKNAKGSFFQHYSNKIAVSDDVLEAIVTLADEYKPAGSHRPDNALTLLDRTIGDAVVQRQVLLEQAKNDPAMLQAIQSMILIPITEKQARKTAIRIMTGNAKKHDLDVDALRSALSAIKGQDDVLEKIIMELRRHDLGLFPRTTPLTMLLAGNSGVGKTEVTKIIAQQLTGVKPIILNMTEYHSSASINRIIGAPAGYVGSDSNAELPFDCLESNPYQVILLDEFEKGDPSVQRLFMSAFDEGYIKTNRGKTVDFSRTIIIATTNAGHTNKSTGQLGFIQRDDGRDAAKTDIKALSRYFDTELLNRFKTILTFNALGRDVYREILQDRYVREVTRIKKDRPRLRLMAAIPDADLDKLVEDTYKAEFGARPAVKAVTDYIEEQALQAVSAAAPAFPRTVSQSMQQTVPAAQSGPIAAPGGMDAGGTDPSMNTVPDGPEEETVPSAGAEAYYAILPADAMEETDLPVMCVTPKGTFDAAGHWDDASQEYEDIRAAMEALGCHETMENCFEVPDGKTEQDIINGMSVMGIALIHNPGILP